MTDYILIEKIWQDIFCYQVKITCASSHVVATNDIYISDDSIDTLFNGLNDFIKGKTKEFFQFLNSEQYKWLVRHNYDSSQVQENLTEAMKTLSYDEIQNTFEQYLSQNNEETELGLETLFAEKGVHWD